jgi:hypothetical protein
VIRRICYCVTVAAVLALLLAACEGGLTLTGASESSRMSPQSGWIEISARKVNGSSVRDLELQWGDARVDTTVALEVGAGSLRIELLDEDDNSTLSLEATPGQPASGSGYVDTDWDGEGSYRMTAAEAENVRIRFEFEVR